VRTLIRLKHGDAPDFVYADEHGKIGLEVTTVHYNQDHAKLVGQLGRGERKAKSAEEVVSHPEEIEFFEFHEPEGSLATSICRALSQKCQKRYGSNCILLIRALLPGLTTIEELRQEVIPTIALPPDCPFSEVFLTADQETYFKLA
jgi:hypothetical protein